MCNLFPNKCVEIWSGDEGTVELFIESWAGGSDGQANPGKRCNSIKSLIYADGSSMKLLVRTCVVDNF